MSRPINVGIIGCGVIAPTHIQSYQQLDNVTVNWACDLVADKAESIAETFGIANTTTDIHEMLADDSLDAVSICTDHASHAELAVAALEAGKHVLCEKALNATLDGVDRMLEAHAKHPELAFGGVFQHRYDPVNRCLKGLIEEGVFGTMLTSGIQMRCLRTAAYYNKDEWRGTWAEEGGAVLINQAIHYIDQLVWLTGGIAGLSGQYANLTHGDVMETEDTAVAALRFKNGALGTLEATCSSHIGWEPTLSFHGSEGSLEMRHDRIMKIIFKDEELGKRVERELAESKENAGVDAGKSYYGTGHPAQIQDFVQAIREERQPFVTAAASRHTVQVVLAIYESHRSGKWIDLG